MAMAGALVLPETIAGMIEQVLIRHQDEVAPDLDLAHAAALIETILRRWMADS